jgi:hypothetical protein
VVGPDQVVGTVLNRVADGILPETGYYKDYYAAATSETAGA